MLIVNIYPTKDEDMKTKILFLLAITAGIFVISDTGVTDESEATWGLHEQYKDCIACHGDQPHKASVDEPHLIDSMPALCHECHKEYASLQGWVHGPVATGECMFCHEPHKTANSSLLSKPIPDLCRQCHETKMLQLVANHSDPSHSNCGDCHEAHTSPGRMLLKQDFFKTDAGKDYIKQNPSIRPQSMFIDRRGSLSGLRGVKVVAVVEKSDLFKRYGLTEDAVRKKVEKRLKQNGIRIIGRKEPILRQAWLYVYLRLMKVPSNPSYDRLEALSGSVNLFLRQKVELPGSPGDRKRRFCTATTWDTGGIVIWSAAKIEEGLDETVKVLVDQFSKDYLKANSQNH